MADHLRRQIREAVATAVTGLATTGARVYQSRLRAVQNPELPCLLIYTRGETSTPITIHSPREIDRVLQVEVIAVVKATADLDDALDGICKEVEIALAMPVTGLDSLCESIALVSSDFELKDDAEKPTGSATLVFEINYFNLENAPDVAH